MRNRIRILDVKQSYEQTHMKFKTVCINRKKSGKFWTHYEKLETSNTKTDQTVRRLC